MFKRAISVFFSIYFLVFMTRDCNCWFDLVVSYDFRVCSNIGKELGSCLFDGFSFPGF